MKIKVLIFFIVLFITNSTYSQQWSDVGGGADNTVQSMYVDTISNLLYVGGRFDHLGVNTVHQIGIWDGNNWSTVGANEHFTINSFSGTINAITIYNGDLIVGGLFDSVAGIPVNNIARWDGSQWSAMGNGFDETVYVMQVYNGELYSGGQFHHSGNDTIYNISKWDGTNWIRLGIGWGLNNVVTSMTIFNQKLVIGGFFTSVYSSPVGGRVVAWDGTNWLSMNGAFNDAVYIIKNINDTLYAGGEFTAFSLNQSYYISKWNGTSWEAMAHPNGGSQPWVTDIVSFNNSLYVSGYFTSPPDLGRFNGAGYDSVCSVSGFLTNMIVYNDELYVDGGFSSINGIPLFNIARYSLANGINEPSSNNSLNVFPNPTSGKFNISLSKSQTESELTICDLLGKTIFEKTKITEANFSIDISDQPKGVYFVKVVQDGRMSVSKLVRM